MTLKELNFQKLLKIDINDVNQYSYDDYKKNQFKHLPIKDYCTLCEENSIEALKDKNNSSYFLCNISHGTHSSDFLKALKNPIETRDWNEDGVMFIMENPSKNYDDMYTKMEIHKNNKEYKKSPATVWYWIHYDLDYAEYPENFKGMKYGELVKTAILTFKLKNAYLTNLLKCGLNDENDNYKGIGEISDECVMNCINEYLIKEVEIINPKVIFTFGSKVYDWVNYIFGKNYKVVGLPHPAGAQRGFKNEYYNVLYFCMMTKWLYKTGVINKEFYIEMMEKFSEYD